MIRYDKLFTRFPIDILSRIYQSDLIYLIDNKILIIRSVFAAHILAQIQAARQANAAQQANFALQTAALRNNPL